MRIKPPFKYYGGKFYLSLWINQQFPPHSTYVEPFGGAASVLLNKEISPVEIYNDLNADLVLLFTYLKTQYAELVQNLQKIPCDEETYYYWKNLQAKTEWERVLRVFVLYRMSRGGTGGSFSKSKRFYRGLPENVAAWETGINNLFRVHQRLQNVQLCCENALELIPKYDGKDTLFYLDPPYVASSRASAKVYLHETSEQLHRDLATLVKNCQGKVLISGYASPLYHELFGSWNQVNKEQFLHASHGARKQTRQEILWKNF